MTWRGYEQDKWSGKRSEKKYFPFSVDKHKVGKVEDSPNNEETTIFFEFNDQTGKVHRIGNLNKVNQKKIVVRARNEQVLAPNWTREYVISSNKDGEDFSLIDQVVSVPDFYLVKDKGIWKTDSNTEITVSDSPI